MAIHDIKKRREDLELITNYDLVAAAHALLEINSKSSRRFFIS